ncbi:hypothetical protein QE152_g38606 [Popillia japonica]|uniref:Retrotransposon gag domain-containing protein n=1 Tax=Popillia japonica TaxID=7064 RepID=A0AAW1HWI2_POPJA
MIQIPTAQLTTRFSTIEDNELIAQATLLDPRFEKYAFSDTSKADKAYVEETVTTYDGGDTYPINRWISEFEEIATSMDWDNVEKLIYGKRLLKVEALLFVRSERGITSWEILKTKLRNEFSKSVNSGRKKRRDETLQQYLLKMREIAAQGNIEEDALIDYVVDGIIDEEMNKTILYGAKSIGEGLRIKMFCV